jgi:acetoacetyl-CoA synthetase
MWTPSQARLASHQLSDFARFVAARTGRDFRYDYAALHEWSVGDRGAFWTSVIEYCGLVYEGSLSPALLDGQRLPGARWFPELRLNYAENLLRHPTAHDAVITCDEAGNHRTYSYGDLRNDCLANMRALAAANLGPGDTVAAILPNTYEALTAMLGTTGLGVTWCSVSPDFGAPGILDRLGQVAPRVLYATRRYKYNGQVHDITEKLATVIASLPGLERVVLVDEQPGDSRPLERSVHLNEFLKASRDAPAPEFRRYPFDHPLFVLFTSGTTGAPKCIEHGAGGTLLQLVKEHALHCNVGPGSRVLFPTTLGWMMWNWLVTSLATGCSIVLYDGSPAHPAATAAFDVIVRERITMVGLASAFIETARKSGLDLRSSHNFDCVDMIFAGGSVLSAEGFQFAHERLFPGKPVYSCSGGTDIVSCFLIANPWGPIYAGELSAPGLGMDVCTYDQQGNRIIAEKGELVCRRAAPSMPLGFRNDPQGERYRAAYFDRFPGVWAHGDFAEETIRGTFIIYGRSDAVLNPGGVRIGTAEIYRHVERIQGIAASVVVGQQVDGDVRVVLFVKLSDGMHLDKALCSQIRAAIRTGASPRHVPKLICQVPDIPLTRSGKVSEVAVRDVVNGRTVTNTEALMNAEALRYFCAPLPEEPV